MLKAMYTGISGMKASQESLSVVSNNIANSQTTAFKSQKAQFEDLFYQQNKAPASGTDNKAGTNAVEIGNGVRLSGIQTNFEQGTVNYTQGKNDLAVQGEGFFVLGDVNGDNKTYTRAGNFAMSQDSELVTQNGDYVLGWNMDPLTGEVNTGSQLTSIKLPTGDINLPVETTDAVIGGNLNINAKVGTIENHQIPTYDRIGGRHDISMNYIKTDTNEYRYVAVPGDQFKESASIKSAVLQPSEGIADKLTKGNYQVNTVAGAGGTVDVSVVGPDGVTIFTQNLNDIDQKVKLNDGTNTWFAIEYQKGGVPSSASFTIAEAGTVTFNSSGQIETMTGSGANGTPLLTYTPSETGQPVNIEIDMAGITGIATDSTVKLKESNGQGASSFLDYAITDGGVIQGYYSDGSTKKIGQIALANFSNVSGLTKSGSNIYMESANSGVAEIGLPGVGARGGIKSQSLEMSNVDLSEMFVELITSQRAFTANTKIIQTGNEVLTSITSLIR